MTQRKGVLERNLNLTAADVNNTRRTRSEVDHLTLSLHSYQSLLSVSDASYLSSI